jgi:hypothetical protein
MSADPHLTLEELAETVADALALLDAHGHTVPGAPPQFPRDAITASRGVAVDEVPTLFNLIRRLRGLPPSRMYVPPDPVQVRIDRLVNLGLARPVVERYVERRESLSTAHEERPEWVAIRRLFIGVHWRGCVVLLNADADAEGAIAHFLDTIGRGVILRADELEGWRGGGGRGWLAAERETGLVLRVDPDLPDDLAAKVERLILRRLTATEGAMVVALTRELSPKKFRERFPRLADHHLDDDPWLAPDVVLVG